MQFKIEMVGREKIGDSIRVNHLCRICGEFCIEHEPVISGGDRCKICRTCTKQLAKFFDDNRSAIISM